MSSLHEEDVESKCEQGANICHDAHFAIGHTLHRGSPFIDGRILRKKAIIRFNDILFDYEILLNTDKFSRSIIKGTES